MVEKLTFNSLATALLDIPAVKMPVARSLNLRRLWHFSGLLLSPAQNNYGTNTLRVGFIVLFSVK
jgi:hypothetical protein